ncbi:hypothetical protein KCU99_g114, partial [Aureobasidium melanogenum]
MQPGRSCHLFSTNYLLCLLLLHKGTYTRHNSWDQPYAFVLAECSGLERADLMNHRAASILGLACPHPKPPTRAYCQAHASRHVGVSIAWFFLS